MDSFNELDQLEIANLIIQYMDEYNSEHPGKRIVTSMYEKFVREQATEAISFLEVLRHRRTLTQISSHRNANDSEDGTAFSFGHSQVDADDAERENRLINGKVNSRPDRPDPQTGSTKSYIRGHPKKQK